MSEEDQVDDIAPTISSPTASSHEETEYQYEELESTQPLWIRLVVILPGFGTEPIRCRIKAVQLDEFTEYAAVSYTWATEDGDASQSQRIHICSGKDQKQQSFLAVTINCEHALQQLRDSRSERTVWIDSVCIDQKNMEERNAQVSEMDHIFKSAKQVDMCIRASSNNLHGALKLLKHDTDFIKRFHRKGNCLTSHAYLHQFSKLLDLRYFSRAWVIQEVDLATKTYLHVGSKAVPFERKTIQSIFRLDQLIHAELLFQDRKSPLDAHWRHWIYSWARDQDRDLITVLIMSHGCSATDPRDKVFAILGLLQPSIRSMIPVDYSLSHEQVLACAAYACIRSCGNLEILRHAALLSTARTSSASSFSTKDFDDYLFRIAGSDQLPSESCVYAVMQSCALIPAKQSLPRLEVAARYLEICTQVTRERMEDLCRRSEPRSNHWTWFFDTISHRFEPSASESHIVAAVEQEVRMASQICTKNPLVAFAAHNSRGFGSSHCVPGDAIFEIFGAPFPFILRQVGKETYRIVGECYLWADIHVGYWNPMRPELHWPYKKPDPTKYRSWTRQIIEVY